LARQFICSVFLANAKRVKALLLDHPELVKERYARGDLALHHAARNGDLEIVKILVESGADVDALSDNKHFPLYCAAGHGHVETTLFLIANGADLEARLEDGKTIVEWINQYADNDKRMKACLDVLKH
jgi:ankyrin repeat protein